MLCKSPDSRTYAELRALNAGLLRILVGRRDGATRLGMSAPVAGQLARLAPDELDFIAGTPVLLAGFEAARSAGGMDRIAEAASSADPYRIGAEPNEMLSCDRAGEPRLTDAWSRAARLFAASLLTWLWKMDERDHLVTALCIGPGERLPALSVPVIESLAGRATERLRVRFGDHPRFWPDLIRAARSRDEELRDLSRLAAVPLVLAEERARSAAR